MKAFRSGRGVAGVVLTAAMAVLGGSAAAVLGVCGPFTDVTDATFCPFVLEIFTLGITTGTTPTTYDPTSSVSRLQMAAFLSRTVDGLLKRGSRRAALDQFSTAQGISSLGLTTVAAGPFLVRSDGADVWLANYDASSVSRVRASDGKLLETWTGAGAGEGVLLAMGRVFVTGAFNPNGLLYRIDPAQPAGVVTTLATNLGGLPAGIAFDGSRIWTANDQGSVSLVTPGASLPWTVTTVTTGFTAPRGVLYDGANIWITDRTAGLLRKLDANGVILQTVTLGVSPHFPVFDGANIWVPNRTSDSISVVRASTGVVLATLTGNGLGDPYQAAFDGERVLVSNYSTDDLSLWKAADLTPLGSLSTGAGTGPTGVCSDGVNFWVTFYTTAKLARF